MTWLLARSAGVGAHLMLFLSVAWSLLATTSLVTKRVAKRSSTAFHGLVASAGLLLLALHLVGLLFDRFVRFDTLDLLISYRARSHRSSADRQAGGRRPFRSGADPGEFFSAHGVTASCRS